MDLEADVVSSALQQHRKDSDLENRRCQATRISFIRNGRTNKFGWLQAPATMGAARLNLEAAFFLFVACRVVTLPYSVRYCSFVPIRVATEAS
jgi:hypothetical protein